MLQNYLLFYYRAIYFFPSINCNIKYEGALILSDLINQLVNLEKLDLNLIGCGIGDEGNICISQAIEQKQQLVCIHLSLEFSQNDNLKQKIYNKLSRLTKSIGNTRLNQVNINKYVNQLYLIIIL
ncbi:hypothetical protein PPERSA_10183 [Pseudocohnilembus persalinus]|uniref:Uncharacterized protein n=1 Tax=Pseudocohnilembus persalinus TaxID=266149 RepID=A0A0V0QLH7_PSEPJ|nr:hypothetical protein PPERSA_10183 [Pseudocohnilembus persalinus]|eukprot:KRX03102.1 hypothetical protein PPERSA_10183 [Pseudocohnilembus persalinus]